MENGLRVILIPNKNSEVVTYSTTVLTGSRDEVEKGKTGFAHFFEHMMFRGTKKYPSEKREEMFALMGADGNAYTTLDRTFYYITFPSEHLENVIDIESDRFQNLSYSKEAFQTEARTILGEYNKNISNIERLLYETHLKLAYTKHTYHHSTMGELEDIENMPNQYDYSLEFFKRYYVPNNCVIIVSGNIDPVKTQELIKKYYKTWFGSVYKTKIPLEPKQENERRDVISMKTTTSPRMLIGYKTPSFKDNIQDIVAIYILWEYLFGENSDFYNSYVIEKQQIMTLSMGDRLIKRDPYLFMIYVKAKDASYLSDIEQAVLNEFSRIENIDQKRLDDIKSHLYYQNTLSLTTDYQIISELVPYVSAGNAIESYDIFNDTINKIKAEDLKSVMKKYITKETKTVVIYK